MLFPYLVTVAVIFIIVYAMPTVFKYEGLFVAIDNHEDVLFAFAVMAHLQYAFTIALTINQKMYMIGYSLLPDSEEE